METFTGRGDSGAVRLSRGTMRPPNISPGLWQISTRKQKKAAIADYKIELEAARLAAEEVAAAHAAAAPSADTECWSAMAAHSVVPRLPSVDEPAQTEPHRDQNAQCYPCCTARKLSRKEMEACPRARKALDAEWEKLRFLKRPHPTKALALGMR